MNILFLSHYFPPEVNAPASRTFEHCREWVAAGHNVTVISCFPHHPAGEIYPGYKNKLYSVEEVQGISLVRVFTYVTANEGTVKRTLNYLIYMFAATIASFFVCKPDIVVTTSPQFFNGLAGYFVSRMRRIPWVLEVRDLWPESILAVGAITNKRVINILESVEEFIYRKADHIVSVTASFEQHIREVSGSKTPITVVRNGVNTSDYFATESSASLLKQLDLQGKFVAAYVGTHGIAHGLEVLLDAAELLIPHSQIVILFIGDGAERDRLQEQVKTRGLSNVRMLGQQPKERMRELWGVTDISLVVLRRLALFKAVIPSKIFESMAMGKPIILGVEGEVKEIIDQSKAGVAVTPESAVDLAEIILDLSQNPSLMNSMSSAGPIFVKEHFERKDLAMEMLNVLHSTLRAQGGRS